MNARPFEAIIFDHDGTLVDTEAPEYVAWDILYKEYGASITMEHWAEVSVGHTTGHKQLYDELIAQIDQDVSYETLRQRLVQLFPITLEKVELMPGVEALLDQLQAANYPMAVATASDRNWVGRWLPRFNLERYFPIVTTRDDVVNNKPAPDVYLLAAEKLGVDPKKCLVFEDSKAGTQAGKSAGMTVVAVPSHVTRTLDFSMADTTVNSLELVTLEWIEALGQRIFES